MAMGFSSHYEQDFSHRKDRLKQKLKKAGEGEISKGTKKK